MTKLPEELHHILGEVAHPSPAFCGFGELGSYVVGLIYSLACTERAFDLISLSHGLGHQGPRKMVAQPNPAVGLVQPFKGGPETVNGQLLLAWLKPHLLVSFNTRRYSFIVKQKKK